MANAVKIILIQNNGGYVKMIITRFRHCFHGMSCFGFHDQFMKHFDVWLSCQI